MNNELESIARLSNQFSKLPGVGGKTAQRYAYFIINSDDEVAKNFSEAILTAKSKVSVCQECGCFVEKGKECQNCKKTQNVICVVEEPKNVFSMEKARSFSGSFHCLHGTINPLAGKGPNDIKIKELLNRVSKYGTEEVIVATNPDIEGEATALYISKLLRPLGIKTTRIAQGVSLGTDLEYVDEVTLSKAIDDRKEI